MIYVASPRTLEVRACYTEAWQLSELNSASSLAIKLHLSKFQMTHDSGQKYSFTHGATWVLILCKNLKYGYR